MSEELALHAASIKGLLDGEALEAIVGLEVEVAESLVESGDLNAHDAAGRRFWALTDAGRERLAAWRDESAGPARDALQGAYDDSFLPVNLRFKRLCSQWQEADDPSELLDEAEEILDDVDAFLAIAEPVSAHYSRYRTRFRDAFERAEEGDADAVAGTGGDSWHDAWFELHEDLIQLLGRDRASEGSS